MQTVKMHFLGNDFVIFNLLNLQDYNDLLPQVEQRIPLIADRRFGMGCDQFVILYPSDKPEECDVRALFFNCDGSQSSACGNATRCIAALTGLESLRIGTKATILQCFVDKSQAKVSVNMGIAKKDPKDIPLFANGASNTKGNQAFLTKIKLDICTLIHKIANGIFAVKQSSFLKAEEVFPLSSLKHIIKDIDFFNFGNPHCVIEIDFTKFSEYFTERYYLKTLKDSKAAKITLNSMKQNNIFKSSIELETNTNLKPHEAPLAQIVLDAYSKFTSEVGRELEACTVIFPQKANIEFAELIDEQHAFFKVWERGTGTTLACGTGACAVGSYFIEKGLVKNNVKIFMDGSVKFAKILNAVQSNESSSNWRNNYIQIAKTKDAEVIMTGGYSVSF